jgi:hypothetical protein
LSKLLVTFICENKHNVETVTVDIERFGEVTEEKIHGLLTKGSYCKECGSREFIYRTRYKG